MSYSVLETIESPRDLRRLDAAEMERLCDEIREFIIETTSVTGGHLASSLGAVELAVAIHRALNTPEDKVIWDVGHQAYAHKILTGRRSEFHTLRQYGGISGFPRRAESEYDVVDSGHAGNSMSYGLGLALARDLRGEDHAVLAVMGDGAMTSGVALEAMNQAGHHLDSNLIIILNDNEMSISRNVGGVAAYLSRLRIRPGYTHMKEEFEELLRTMPALGDGIVRIVTQIKESMTNALVPGMLFEAFGLKYVGPIDGHDVAQIVETIRQARRIGGPVLIHALTRKGKGYRPSEHRPDRFHGVPSFDSGTGEMLKKGGGESWTGLFGEAIVKIAEEEPRLVAITAAMKLGTGLEEFSERFGERFFDVGIAEQLGVNLAAGLAIGGLKPVVAIYSTFLQRAFDQLAQEICLQDLPVIIAVDRAGLVGEDGSTHHGYFDISYLRILPNMTIMAPCAGVEMESMLRFALGLESPVALRFPRGRVAPVENAGAAGLELGKGEVVRPGDDVSLLALGCTVPLAMRIAGILESEGVSAAVVNARFAKPLDPGFIQEVGGGKRLLVTLENNVVAGGFGEAVMAVAGDKRLAPVMMKGLPDRYVEHGGIPELQQEVGLSDSNIAGEIVDRLDRL
ncbi:MAG: 1-deoxy-D-xylulose-5-phosphate synthase [Actinobacteria bacterium]|nr:1-deoxy-D-xylulose-5-phosphate synthase [Actinomycetota bacterium]MCG2820079.1 1-deoxy-D-xylulose-5-phosphate synthase [Actinomycetes bacterium]MBU4179563.1 1-deoxy-D-xylulose-5-phosphate synthase [Actinomycetota bacterium]MBU4218978.1 1-deoxy-D-xylulose-5-phosphate synthase [Actinomycetota bacterium]MBU4359166.1 1-deoxy-D-xylulose-5-phosphate synthase [Actinomycetota bacterium]